MENVRWPVVVGGALIAIGSFLPWAQAGIFSMPGTSGDGVLTLIAGVIILAIGFSKKEGRAPGVGILLLSVISGLIALNVLSNMAPIGDVLDLDVPNAGSGLYVVGLGSLIAFASGFGVYTAPPTTKAPAPPEGETGA